MRTQFEQCLKLGSEVSAPAAVVERTQALLARSHTARHALEDIASLRQQQQRSPQTREATLLQLHAIAQENHFYALELEFATQLLDSLHHTRVGDVALANDRIGLAHSNLQRHAAAARAHANAQHLHQTVASEMCSVLYQTLATERKGWRDVARKRRSDTHPTALTDAMQRPNLTRQVNALRVAVEKLKECSEPGATEALELVLTELVRMLHVQGQWAWAQRAERELMELRAAASEQADGSQSDGHRETVDSGHGDEGDAVEGGEGDAVEGGEASHTTVPGTGVSGTTAVEELPTSGNHDRASSTGAIYQTEIAAHWCTHCAHPII